MGLTGVSPTRRTPGDIREFVFAAGPGSSGATWDVLIYGNKTSSGSETVDTIGSAVLDKNDCIARFGRRSEAYHMWRLLNVVDKLANVYIIAPTPGAGSAAAVAFTFGANNSATVTGTTTCKLEFQGESVEFLVSSGETSATICGNAVTAFNNASEGSWMATAAQGSSSNTHVMTITGSQLGPRLDALFEDSARASFVASVGMSIAKGSVTAGVTEDDFTAAYAAASAGEYTFQVNPKYSTSAPTSSDNGVGEGITYIREQNLPINGKFQTMHFGLVGTQAQSTTVATDSDANSTLAYFYHAEDNDWTPGMIAAHAVGIVRSQFVKHPAFNITAYHSSDNTIMVGPPDPYDKTDRPTATEIELDLSNGVTPVAFSSRGAPYLPRHVTSYSEVSAGVKDYRASEGHIPFATEFAWETLRARWQAEKQPFLADDPVSGAKPLPKTSTASQLKALANGVIDELSGPRPLGLYEGPILSPSPADVKAMRDSIEVVHSPGALRIKIDFKVVEHNLKSEWTIREVSAAY